MPIIPWCPDCFDTLHPATVEATAPSGWVDLLVADIDITLASSTTADPCAAVSAAVRVRGTTSPAESCVLVTVKNVGGRSASSFWVDLFLDETDAPVVGDLSSWYATVPSLAAGGSTTVLFSGVPLPAEWIDVVLDTGGKVSEYRESNNVRSLGDS